MITKCVRGRGGNPRVITRGSPYSERVGLVLSTMARPKPEWKSYNGGVSASGDRDVLIVASVGEVNVDSQDVVPRCSIELTAEHRTKLTNQGIPEECTDDLSIIKARIALDKHCHLVGEEINEPGRELTRNHILGQVENLMKKSDKPGVLIYYFGHGKKNTGDWCFKDGYITFKDITELYNRFCKGTVLTIVSDCSHSGHWVKACCEYLDGQEILACGHSAHDKGILLKVYTSCKPNEEAATPCFSVRAVCNDKNNGTTTYYMNGCKLRENQHTYGIDFTNVQCKKMIDEPCALSPEFTWQRRDESERIFLVRGKDRGREAWHYVLLVDDDETIKQFREKVASGTVDVANYGFVLKSGWGKDPPNEVVDWIDKSYKAIYS